MRINDHFFSEEFEEELLQYLDLEEYYNTPERWALREVRRKREEVRTFIKRKSSCMDSSYIFVFDPHKFFNQAERMLKNLSIGTTQTNSEETRVKE